MEIRNKKVPNDLFFAERKEVLKQWPTGDGVDFDEVVKYQSAIPDTKRFGKKLMKAELEGETLTQPRAGVALCKEHIELLRYLETEGEADLLPTTVDAYTRLNRDR